MIFDLWYIVIGFLSWPVFAECLFHELAKRPFDREDYFSAVVIGLLLAIFWPIFSLGILIYWLLRKYVEYGEKKS